MKKLEMKQKAEKEYLENKIKALKHADESFSKAVLEKSEQKQSGPKRTLSLPDNSLCNCQTILLMTPTVLLVDNCI